MLDAGSVIIHSEKKIIDIVYTALIHLHFFASKFTCTSDCQVNVLSPYICSSPEGWRVSAFRYVKKQVFLQVTTD